MDLRFIIFPSYGTWSGVSPRAPVAVLKAQNHSRCGWSIQGLGWQLLSLHTCSVPFSSHSPCANSTQPSGDVRPTSSTASISFQPGTLVSTVTRTRFVEAVGFASGGLKTAGLWAVGSLPCQRVLHLPA